MNTTTYLRHSMPNQLKRAIAKGLLAMTALILGHSPAVAQKTLDFDALSIDDGFSSSKAISIIQDKKGYIWVGTWNGLTRYDGYKAEIFRPWHHDSASISNKEIVSLMQDHAGYIWIGTSDGLNRMDPETGNIKTYPFNSRIMSIYEDKAHQIWVGTWYNGLFLLNPETGKTKKYLEYDVVSDIHEDAHGEFWIATYDGLVNLNRQTSGFIRYKPNPSRPGSSINNSVTTQIAETQDGALWVGVWDGGVNKITNTQDKGNIKFQYFTKQNRNGSLVANDVYRLITDQYGNLWIGTWSGGLSLMEPGEQAKSPNDAYFSSFVNEATNPYGISGNNITALMVDQAGVLWVGASKIDRACIVENGMTRINTSRFSQGTFSKSSVRSFSGSTGNRLWVGTTDVIKQYRKLNDRYEFVKDIGNLKYSHNGTTYQSSSVLAILEQPSGLWVGTDDAGLLFFPSPEPEKTGQPSFRYWNKATTPALPDVKVCNIVQSRVIPNTLWLGTMHSGLVKCTYNNGQMSLTTIGAGNGARQLSDNNIRTITEDKEGMVWIGTQKGLNRLDPTTGLVDHFFYSSTDTTSINDNVINVVYEDKDGNLWVATNAGLNKKTTVKDSNGKTTMAFKGFSSLDYLNNDVITFIQEDANSNLWLGTYLGIVKFNKKDETIGREFMMKEYSRLGYERNASFTDNDGTFLLGGINGILAFHPDRLTPQSIAPKVTITDLLIYNQSVDMQTQSGGNNVLSKTLPFTDGITLSYNDNVFTINFSAMDYKNPKKNKYAYFLEGFDRKWNEIGNRNSATYTSIPQGKYVFKVKGCNSDGVWSEQATELKVTILPPWWKTWPAYIAYGLIFIGLLYFFKQYSVVQMEQKNRLAMEHLKYEKERELNEMKSQFFTNITHEFRTPLSLILGPTNELLARKELPPYVSKQALLIQKSAQRLLRLVNQLIEFRKVENENMQITLQPTDVTAMLDDAHDAFTGMAESRNIKFDLQKKQAKLVANIDADKFDKIVFNLLSNAFKFTEDGGEITLRFDKLEKNPDWFYVEVADTGIGISDDKKELIFNRFYQINQIKSQSTGGIGLYLAKAFAELHNGRIELESEHGKGSIFRVILPANGNAVLHDEPLPREDAPAAHDLGTNELMETEENDAKLPVLLLVEDDHDMNDFIATGLENEFSVISCFNGREGLEQARKLMPDLIVSDVMMPEMGGFDLCKQLRKDINTSHIPLVFLTAKTMKDDEIKGLKLGAVDYITKPFDLTTLKLKLKNILLTKHNMQEKLRTNMLLEPEEIELTSIDETFLKEIVEAVNKHLDNPVFDVELLSKEVAMSPNQVYRKIKSLTGQTAKEFIRSQRLKTSASMLLQKKRTISEIIYMVGFSSPSYFARCFKEHFGCTPTEYIERNG